MAEILPAGELERRCAALAARGRRVRIVDGAFDELAKADVIALARARAGADRLAVVVHGDPELVAALACVDYVCVLPPEEAAQLRARLARPVEPRAPARRIVSRHADRVVYDEGERFVKEFSSKRARDAELKQLWRLEAIGIGVPRVVETPGTSFVTAKLPGESLDRIVRRRWPGLGRRERNRLIDRVASLCRRLRDAGYDWPDLVSYHVWVADERIFVLDPARLRRGRLDLSPLYWSTEEPTVSRADRLRFWRAYAGRAAPPRLRRIGHRGRFRPYRWMPQAREPRPCPPWSDFVDAVGTPFGALDEIAQRMEVKRTLADRVNGEIDDLVVKITVDPRVAQREWESHRLMMAAGFRVPQPAVGGTLKDGRGLFATRRLEGLEPMDQIWSTLDPRRAVRAIADLVRRLHAGGLVHKDLYLNHLFVAPGGDEITLIDLGRLAKTRSRRLRVKDLAALLLGVQRVCTRTEIWRGFRRYGGDKRLARAVRKKAVRMARHVPQRVRDGSHSIAPCTSV